MHVKFRLPQFEHGCWPEHLIFCLRHREQLIPDVNANIECRTGLDVRV